MKNSEKFWSKLSYNPKKALDQPSTTQDYGNIRKYLSESDCLLDFGCGNGVTDIHLANYVKKIVGIDTSAGTIETANSNLDYSKIKNCSFYKMSLSNEALTKKYNAVLTMSVLQYIEDLEGTIQRISEILVHDGYFISTAAYVGESSSLTIKIIQSMSKLGVIPNIYSRKVSDITRLIEIAGLELVEMTLISKKYSEYLVVARKL